MHNTKMLARDLGTVLVGQEAVDGDLLMRLEASGKRLKKLYEMIDEKQGGFNFC